MIDRCQFCRARFFDNDESQKYARSHLRMCRGIDTKDPDEYKKIVFDNRRENAR